MSPVYHGSDICQPMNLLHSASRPQRHSSCVPQHHDWGYESAIFKHNDKDDSPNQRNVWDDLEYDAQVGLFGREQRQVAGPRVRQGGRMSLKKTGSSNGGVLNKSKNGIENTGIPTNEWPNQELESDELEKVTPEANRKASQVVIKCDTRAGKTNAARAHSRAHTLTVFRSSNEITLDGKEGWERIGLIVRLRFKRKNFATLQHSLGKVSPTPHLFSTPRNRVTTPISHNTSWTSATASTSHVLDPIGTVYTYPLFERQWKDETRSFSMKKVVETLRPHNKIVEELPVLYNWFPEAVPVDAIFPPGVPLSAKEIHVKNDTSSQKDVLTMYRPSTHTTFVGETS
jgi:hypothetical protein